MIFPQTFIRFVVIHDGGRIISIPCFSPAGILHESSDHLSFLERSVFPANREISGRSSDRSIDRSIIRLSRPRLSYQSKDGPREAEPVHDRYNHVGRRDLICRWRSVNWRQSHGRWLPPFSPPFCTLRAILGCSLTASHVFFACFQRNEEGVLPSLIRPSMKRRATALFRNPGEAVGFCPCHLSIGSRTALDPLFRSCHISCPALGSTGQFSEPKFFQTSARLSRARVYPSFPWIFMETIRFLIIP